MRYFFVLILLLSCTTRTLLNSRSPSSANPFTCRNLVDQIIFPRGFFVAPIEIRDIPEPHMAQILSMSESLKRAGIEFEVVRKMYANDVFGIEILPSSKSKANKYIKRVQERFDGVRVFYLSDIGGNANGSYSYTTNIVRLNKTVMLSLEELKSETTLAHEFRHAWFSSRANRKISGPYQGDLTSKRGVLDFANDSASYGSYQSFEEVYNHTKDLRKLLSLLNIGIKNNEPEKAHKALMKLNYTSFRTEQLALRTYSAVRKLKEKIQSTPWNDFTASQLFSVEQYEGVDSLVLKSELIGDNKNQLEITIPLYDRSGKLIEIFEEKPEEITKIFQASIEKLEREADLLYKDFLYAKEAALLMNNISKTDIPLRKIQILAAFENQLYSTFDKPASKLKQVFTNTREALSPLAQKEIPEQEMDLFKWFLKQLEKSELKVLDNGNYQFIDKSLKINITLNAKGELLSVKKYKKFFVF